MKYSDNIAFNRAPIARLFTVDSLPCPPRVTVLRGCEGSPILDLTGGELVQKFSTSERHPQPRPYI